ncbi:hypothetical protein BDR22DRAFT_823817 [Usnea florida]
MLGDGQQLVNALPPEAASLELGQNCEIVEIVLDHVGELFTLAFYKSQAAYWEELHALGEGFVSFWEVGVDVVCDAGKVLTFLTNSSWQELNGCFFFYLCFLCFLCPLIHVPCGSR